MYSSGKIMLNDLSMEYVLVRFYIKIGYCCATRDDILCLVGKSVIFYAPAMYSNLRSVDYTMLVNV